jgi:hypothetical protein
MSKTTKHPHHKDDDDEPKTHHKETTSHKEAAPAFVPSHPHDPRATPAAPAKTEPDKPVESEKKEDDKLLGTDGKEVRVLPGVFVKIKKTGRIGYLQSYDADQELSAQVNVFTVSIAGQGVGASPEHCKLCDLDYLYDA